MVNITIRPEGRSMEVPEGSNLLKSLQKNGIPVESPCGGKGTCNKCQVEVGSSGQTEKVLACAITVDRDMEVWVEEKSQFSDRKSLLNREKTSVPVELQVESKELMVEEVTLQNPVSGLDRLFESLGENKKVSIAVLEKLPVLVGSEKSRLQAVWEDDSMLGIFPHSGGIYGAAIDIGTTTMVCQLVDLTRGEVIGIKSGTNPQGVYGADVVSRIAYQNENRENCLGLKKIVQESVNRMILEAAEQAQIDPQRIFKAALCGNTVMIHLFLGMEAEQIAKAPYVPPFRQVNPLQARETDLQICPDAGLHFLPNIAGYVGGDTTSMILALGLDQTEETVMAIDLGTNGEIVLVHQGTMYTCATAAGPAFEGAKIDFGMRADAGAIEELKISPEEYGLKTIDKAPAHGLCGSGLIDAVAEYVRWGLIDRQGKIRDIAEIDSESAFLGERLGSYNGGRAILVASVEKGATRNVWLTQKDVRELQLGKAAVMAGSSLLLDKAGLKMEELNRIYLAGAFGNYVDPQSVLNIKMLPSVEVSKIEPVGNAAGWGAVMALCSARQRKRAEKISREARYFELSADQEFQKVFMNAIRF